MLECRLFELEQSPVWRHVIVEAAVNHRGEPKPLHFAESRTRFARWLDRIIYVVARVPDRIAEPGLAPWDREHQQRNCACDALSEAGPDDLVLISDVDEIPSAVVWAAAPPVVLMQRVAVFAVDWLWPRLEPTGVLVRVRDALPDLAAARDARLSYPPLPEAGWHLSWMGGQEAWHAKLAAHCHLEQDTSETVARIVSGAAYSEGWHIGVKLLPARIDHSWPQFIQQGRFPASWRLPVEHLPPTITPA